MKDIEKSADKSTALEAFLCYENPSAHDSLVAYTQQVARENALPWRAPAPESSGQLFLKDPFLKNDSAKPEEKHDSKEHNWFSDACDALSGAVDLVAQAASGAAITAYKEVTEHPVEVVTMLAEGVVIGGAIIAAAPVAAALGASAAVVGGIGLAADASLAYMTVSGTVSVANDVVQAAQGSSSSADVLFHKSQHTEAEIDSARVEFQNKTGKAVLEVASTAALAAVGFAGKGKLQGGIVESLPTPKLTLGSAEPLALPYEKPVLALPAPEEMITPRAPERVLSLPAPAGVLNPEMEMRVPSFAERRQAARDYLTRPRTELAPGAAPKLMEEIDDMLLSRQKEVDVKALWDRLEAASAQERPQLEARIGDELQLRRELLTELVNDYAPALFPGRVLPDLEVTRLKALDQSVKGSYSQGRLSVSSLDLMEPSYFKEDENTGFRFINAITHEMEHGEQQGLMMRNLIEIVTNGDTTGRVLTASEISSIQKLAVERADMYASPSLIESVNAKRPRRLLSPDEVKRAEALEESSMAFSQSYDSSRYHEVHAADLRQELSWLENAPGMSPREFNTQSMTNIFGQKEVLPAKIQELVRQFEQLPKAEKYGYTEEQYQFAKASTQTVIQALKEELDRFRLLKDKDYAEYRAWQHEKEAFAVGEQATKQLNLSGPLYGYSMLSDFSSQSGQLALEDFLVY